MRAPCSEPGCPKPRAASSKYCHAHKQFYRNVRGKERQPRVDGLCVCDCGEPAAPGSIYASKTCNRRMWRRRYNQTHQDSSNVEKLHKGVNKSHKGAVVYYHDGWQPDPMSKAKALQFLAEGAFQMGDVIQIGDKRITINQEALF